MRRSPIASLALLALVYPLVVYLGLARHGAREVGLVAALLRGRSDGPRRLAPLSLPLTPLALIVALVVASGELAAMAAG